MRLDEPEMMGPAATALAGFVRDGWTACGYRYKQIDGSTDICVYVAKTRAGHCTVYARRG